MFKTSSFLLNKLPKNLLHFTIFSFSSKNGNALCVLCKGLGYLTWALKKCPMSLFLLQFLIKSSLDVHSLTLSKLSAGNFCYNARTSQLQSQYMRFDKSLFGS